VSKVQRKQDKNHYALKAVNIKKLQPREREDAVNEIRVLASIRHKNIVRYCDAFVERDSLYICMEFAEHGDIGRQIEKFKKANKYIKEDTVWAYLIQIASGLQAMHNRSPPVLHRDIKAKNVFLTGKNLVRLGDLGCAKLLKAGMARTQIGTPYYMSPEIWAQKPYDAKSDVWAVGCLVYELCMLQPPFLANDMNGLAAKIKTSAAPRVSKHYSEDLANLVALMLAKDPRARPTVNDIIQSAAVQARMHLVPQDEENEWAGEHLRQQMIATIKVPAAFGYGGHAKGGQGGLVLPAPSFPAPAPATAAPPPPPPPAQLAAPPAEASAPAAAPSLAPAAAPSAAAFAACTSPPHLGRAAAAKENGFAAAKPAPAPAPRAAPAAVIVAKRPSSAAAALAPAHGNAHNVVAAPQLPAKAGGAVAAYIGGGAVLRAAAPAPGGYPAARLAPAAPPAAAPRAAPLMVAPVLRGGGGGAVAAAIAAAARPGGFAANAVAAAPRYHGGANAGLIARYGGGGAAPAAVLLAGGRPAGPSSRPW